MINIIKFNNIIPSIIIGSGFLSYYNIRESNDIDIIVPCLNKYKYLGEIHKSIYGTNKISLLIKNVEVEIFDNDGFGKSFDNIDKQEIERNIYLVTFNEFVTWKIKAGRDKDYYDLNLLY